MQQRVTAQWGSAERDPFFHPSRLDCGHFGIPGFRCGNVAVLIQPARGYNRDPKATYHDPALVPPHAYLATYAWLADEFRADAVIDLGKHGTSEWLPGKALALSAECFPEAALGPLPHLYPFIVNDPGEGTQAKRRAQAVIVDHLTPPLTRAGSYGEPAELERLIDEYYDAARGDPRRIAPLAAEILERARAAGIDRDCGIEPGDERGDALRKLDGFLCELKELQIRDGLHVFGTSPDRELLNSLLLSIARARRGAAPQDESLLRALAADLGLGIRSADRRPRRAVDGAKACDPCISDAPWRTVGDTVERLEALALRLVAGRDTARCRMGREPARCSAGSTTRCAPQSRPAASGEIAGTPRRTRRPVRGAGAVGRAEPRPARGTADRAQFLLARHPRGTDPGGVAARLAFGRALGRAPRPGARQLSGAHRALRLGHRQHAHRRRRHRPGAGVDRRAPRMGTGERPGHRVRDIAGKRARPAAGRCHAAHLRLFPRRLPRPHRPLRQRGARRRRARRAGGHQPACRALRRRSAGARNRRRRAGGRRPPRRLPHLRCQTGRLWRGAADDDRRTHLGRRGDLAEAWLTWGQYAYAAGGDGTAERGLLETRLAAADAVVHNQDNREHDLLDSDDYYQFEGGLALVVRHLSGRAPAVYHNDHSVPDRPRIRTLREELGRVVRGRAANPRWIAGVMRHGYKGAAEIAATVDYLFAFAATARAVDDAHFEALYDAYLGDDRVRDFIEQANPAALGEIRATLCRGDRARAVAADAQQHPRGAGGMTRH